MLVWVNACTEKVQNCRQNVAINTVVLTKNQNSQTPGSTRKLVAKGVTLKAEGDLEEEHLRTHGRIWSIVPCSRDLPDNVHSASDSG